MPRVASLLIGHNFMGRIWGSLDGTRGLQFSQLLPLLDLSILLELNRFF
jgi:hypothetical protein